MGLNRPYGTVPEKLLAEIYQKRTRFVVMFISKYYVEKAWPSHERRHAQARALYAKEEYILPARFDDTEVPGLASTVGYIDLRSMNAAELPPSVPASVTSLACRCAFVAVRYNETHGAV